MRESHLRVAFLKALARQQRKVPATSSTRCRDRPALAGSRRTMLIFRTCIVGGGGNSLSNLGEAMHLSER